MSALLFEDCQMNCCWYYICIVEHFSLGFDKGVYRVVIDGDMGFFFVQNFFFGQHES
jgi:hypothetical protein